VTTSSVVADVSKDRQPYLLFSSGGSERHNPFHDAFVDRHIPTHASEIKEGGSMIEETSV
jgi:hypothetical protein